MSESIMMVMAALNDVKTLLSDVKRGQERAQEELTGLGSDMDTLAEQVSALADQVQEAAANPVAPEKSMVEQAKELALAFPVLKGALMSEAAKHTAAETSNGTGRETIEPGSTPVAETVNANG